MTPYYQSCLGPKILSELHVEDPVAPYKLVVLWDIILPPFKHLKSGADVLHLHTDGITPECVPILLIYLLYLFNRFGDANTKLVGPKPIL